MRGKARSGVNVGGSYILVIFVLLCLTTFATLSMVSANADYSLSKKAAGATALYYQADARAEELMAQADQTLAEAYPLARDAEDFYRLCAEHLENLSEDYQVSWSSERMTITYGVPAQEGQELAVVLEAAYPQQGEGPRLVRREWRIVNTVEWEPQDPVLALFDGDDLPLMILDD